MKNSIWLPTAKKDSKENVEQALLALRRFHFSGQKEEEVAPDLLPAFLYDFWNLEKARYEYPIFLFPVGYGDQVYQSFSKLIREKLDLIAPGEGSAQILRDNLPRLEAYLQSRLNEQELLDATLSLKEAGEALLAELGLVGDNKTELENDLNSLIAELPEGGQLLGFCEKATLHLLDLAIKRAYVARRGGYVGEIEKVEKALIDLLKVEATKSEGSRSAKSLRGSLGTAAGLDFSKLSKRLGNYRGTERIDEARHKRVESVLATLQGYKASAEVTAPTLFFGEEYAQLADCGLGWELKQSDNPCEAASAYFCEQTQLLTDVFRAMRIGSLELEGAYRAEYHDTWFEEFDDTAFSKEEWLLLPPVIVMASAEHLVESEMLGLSRLMLANYPVRVIAFQHPTRNPGMAQGENPLAAGRFELGYLGMSHREAMVHQSSPAQPEHFLRGWFAALDTTLPSLHVLPTSSACDRDLSSLQSWLFDGAMLEGRAHPFFLYNPEAGIHWAQRFDFDGNPQTDNDWPESAVAYKSEGGEIQSLIARFTFADCALLDRAYRGHFMALETGAFEDVAISVEDYLSLDEADKLKKIPFVWAVDGEGSLQRLAISRELAYGCRQHLNYWHTLQELAGVHNEYVEQALAVARKEAAAELEAERARLTEEFNRELERVRNETAGEAMERLAATLVQTDISLLTTSVTEGVGTVAPSVATEASPETGEAGVEVVEEPEADEEDDISFDDPWIDSPLCSSCGDCLKINPQVFVYNSNKQAIIVDPENATFAQLVEAAEKCPTRCIHPGRPLDPNEEQLDELIERAKPFN